MIQEEEISEAALYHWVRSKESDMVELPCFSVITQRALGQIYVADSNAFPFPSPSLPTHTHTRRHTVSQRSAMCLQYGRSWSRGLCVSVHLRGNGALGRLLSALYSLCVTSHSVRCDISMLPLVVTFSLIIHFVLFVKNQSTGLLSPYGNLWVV